MEQERKYGGAAVGSMVLLDLNQESGSAGDRAFVAKYLDERGVAEGFTNLLCGLIKHQPADSEMARWAAQDAAVTAVWAAERAEDEAQWVPQEVTCG